MSGQPGPARAGGLMHLSDLHFGAEDPLALDALHRLVEALRPELIAVTGDLTQRATAAQFAAARAFLGGLATPRLLVQPGNHDVPLWAFWERWFSPFRRYEQAFGSDRTPVADLPWLRLVMADSVAPHRHAEGALTDAEIERVRALLAAAQPQQLRAVALHHPPVGGLAVLPGGRQALAAWQSAGVDLVFSGHGHTPGLRSLREDRSHAAHQAWSVQGGTAVSRRVRNGQAASVGTLLPACDGRAVWVQRWDLAAEQGRFLPCMPLLLPLRGQVPATPAPAG